MEYRFVGKTGVQVSALCFGTLSFEYASDEQACAALFRRSREAGINFFDVANVYANGRAEEILGRLIAGCRDDLVIASKVGFPTSGEVNARGLSRRHIMMAVQASLKRLRTDYLDFYFLHTFDANTPIEETLRALDDLVRQGKVLYLGVSNWAAWQIALALGISAREGLAPFHCVQPMYNLVKRQAEVEILPLAQAARLGVVSYSPLGGGLLTGKYTTKSRPDQGRLVDYELYAKRYSDPIYCEIAERFAAHARERGVHPATLGVAWVMSHPAVTAPIIGARNLEQLETVLDAPGVDITPDWRAEISALSIEPPPATDRSEERAGIVYRDDTAASTDRQ
ncbi:MAG: aldo/keto reductase [Anaerolineae bacterium]|jgi:aryl-alcohol dehydrogenase-like predicted oxidoreductase